MYLIIIGLIIISALVFYNIKHTAEIREKHKDQISFIMAIVATFIGVFLGLYFANLESENNRKKERQRISETIIKDSERVLTSTSLNYYLSLKAFEENYQGSMKLRYIQFPKLLKQIINSENVLKYFEPELYGLLSTQLRVLEQKHKELETLSKISKTEMPEVKKYCYLLCYSLELVYIQYLYASEQVNNNDINNYLAYFLLKNFKQPYGKINNVEKVKELYRDYVYEFEKDSEVEFQHQ